MTTVLDSFVIEFGLDHRPLERNERELVDFLRKTNEQALGQANQIESHVKKTFDLLSNMRREALTVLTLFFGGREIGEFVNHITSLDAATGRLAVTLGMSTQETSAWGGAIRQAGGTAEGANSALAGLSSEMSRFQLTGQSGMLPVLSRLGISLYDSNHNLKTAGQLWLELSGAVQGMNAREATAFLQMIPGATQDMINFALLGPAKMKEYIQASREAGVTTAQSAAAARDYQRAIAQLDQSSTNLGRTLVTMVAPAISAVSTSLAKLLQSWQTQPGSAEDKNRDSTQRSKLVQRFGSPGDIIRKLATPMDGSQATGLDAWLLRKADEWYGPAGSDTMTSAKSLLASRLSQYGGPNLGNSNWNNFLYGLSFLETDHRNIGNATSSAKGYFQFLDGTAQKARTAGLPDPRAGSYQDQAESTMAYIKRFYPGAASSIEKGDFNSATAALRGEWPSLPGGSQPQSASRYAAFSRYLAGEGPGSGGTKSVTVNVGGVTVNTSSDNGKGIGDDVDGALRRSITAGAANYGAQ